VSGKTDAVCRCESARGGRGNLKPWKTGLPRDTSARNDRYAYFALSLREVCKKDNPRLKKYEKTFKTDGNNSQRRNEDF
jgi:hypothetical protein